MKKLTLATAASTVLTAAAIALAGPALSAVTEGGQSTATVAAAPVTISLAGANPLVPVGPNPSVPGPLGFYNPNVSDDSGTVNPAGGIDLAS